MLINQAREWNEALEAWLELNVKQLAESIRLIHVDRALTFV
jgi:hypothetical protein